MKLRKNTQMSLLNPKGAGRKPLHDKAIRHSVRPKFNKPRSLHLTLKVRSNKADIQSKKILKALHHAIRRARLKNLKIIHYSLEYNHVHLLVEASSHQVLHSGMQALGISLSKAINKIKKQAGTVYKHRYHFRRISSPKDYRNVLRYILGNGIKHGNSQSIINPYNSALAETKLRHLYPKQIWADITKSHLDLKQYRELLLTLSAPGIFYKWPIVQ
jgi:REP element-mobilizing transposase RayT